MIAVTHFKVNHLVNPTSLTPGMVSFSWIPYGALRQLAFELEINIGEKGIYSSGKIYSSECILNNVINTEGAANYYVKIRLYDEQDLSGEWSEWHFGTVPDRDDISAFWIDPEPWRPDPPVFRKTALHNLKKMLTKRDDPIPRYPAAYLKKEFMVDRVLEETFLYITCHGVYQVTINGKIISDFVLAPGFTQYDKFLNMQAYRIDDVLNEGRNEICVMIGDGWYRGSIDNERNLNSFGSDIALLAEIRAGDRTIVRTDESWIAASNGPLGINDLQLGEQYDANRELQNADWHPVKKCAFPFDNIIGSDCPPVTEHERLKPKILKTPDGQIVLDFGQNISGYVEVSFEAHGGEKLTLTHGETLNKYGNFTQENILAPTKPAAYQQIFYTAAPGYNHYKPATCFFGFRYVKVEANFEIQSEYFTAIAVYSDMQELAEFHCGNEKVNRLFKNVMWSMKGNFLSIMTDCPTRERSGYTGDGQVFCHTGLYLMDCAPVYDHWLKSLSACFHEDNGMRMFAPNVHAPGIMDSSHGWCDAIVIIPYLLWKRTGDISYISRNYEASKKWVDYALKRAAGGCHRKGKKLARELRPYFADQGFTFGEWLEAGHSGTLVTIADMVRHMIVGEPEVSTAYMSWSCRLLSEMAGALGDEEARQYYGHAADMAARAYRAAFTSDGHIPRTNRQCRYIRPVVFGILNESESREASVGLKMAVDRNGGHLNTGFLTTPYICRTLSDYGQTETAYNLLLKEDSPSWLYEVKKGATTIWENWNGVHQDGKTEGSHNHYSLGAVAGWMMDSVCGIRITDGHITICPRPDRRLESASASYLSPAGMIESSWRIKEKTIIYTVSIPCNKEAQFVYPDGRSEKLTAGIHELRSES